MELGWISAQDWQDLLPVMLFLYALIVLLAATTFYVIAIRRVWRRLPGVHTREQLVAAFEQSRLMRLGSRIFDLAPVQWPSPRGSIVLQSPFSPERARREVAYLYRDWLIHVHFFTALAVLLVIIGLHWLEDYAHLANPVIPLPNLVPVFLAAILLIFIGTLCRLAISSEVEPLLDRMLALPFATASRPPLLVGVEDFAGGAAVSNPTALPAWATAQVIDAIEGAEELIKGGHKSLHEPMMQLSASTEALAAIAKAMSEHWVGRRAYGNESVAGTGASIDARTPASKSRNIIREPNGYEPTGDRGRSSNGRNPASHRARGHGKRATPGRITKRSRAANRQDRSRDGTYRS